MLIKYGTRAVAENMLNDRYVFESLEFAYTLKLGGLAQLPGNSNS